jgi:N-methylhydantoinase B
MVRTYRYLLDDTVVQVRSDREKTPPYGLNGGLPSTTTKVTVTKGGHTKVMPGKFLENLNSGDELNIVWPGAGGWGDPLDREPEAVLWDVIEEKVSLQRARDVYGLVIDMEFRAIDWERTRRLREERSQRARKASST